MSVLLVTVDWKLAPNMRNSYVPSSIIVMDLPGREMDTCKFCITTVQFCDKCDAPFDSDIIKTTAYTGCAAAGLKILGATTIHRAAQLNSKNPQKQSTN